jgi:hypothetical protein
MKKKDFKNFIIKYMLRFSDKNTSPYYKVSANELFKRTLRYKLAGLGIAVTDNEKFLLSLKNKHKNKRCFIIGNGPSLNKCDLTLLKNEITFGFNSIFLNIEKMGFIPTYYVVEDRLVAEDRKNEINEFAGPIKFFGNHISDCLIKQKNTYWLNAIMDYTEYADFPNFSTNPARQLWVGGTVTYLAMQLAYFMGFSEVYMIGYDHHYVIPSTASHDKNTARIMSNDADPNHFHADYFGKGYRWHDPRVDRMEQAYLKAKNYFEAANKKILNATVGGKLEVFERIDYNTLFNKK